MSGAFTPDRQGGNDPDGDGASGTMSTVTESEDMGGKGVRSAMRRGSGAGSSGVGESGSQDVAPMEADAAMLGTSTPGAAEAGKDMPSVETLEKACGSLDTQRMESLVSKVGECQDKQKSVWLRGTVVSPPEACAKVTFRKGKRMGTQLQKTRVWIVDVDGARMRVTFLGVDVWALRDKILVHEEYYFGELLCEGVEEKWVSSGLEFTGWEDAELCPVGSEELRTENKFAVEFVDPATLAQQKPGANINIEGVVLEVGPLVQGEKLRKVTVAFFPGTTRGRAAEMEEEVAAVPVKRSVVLSMWRKHAQDFPTDCLGQGVVLYNVTVGEYNEQVQLSTVQSSFWELQGEVAPWWNEFSGEAFPVVKSNFVTPLNEAEVVPLFHYKGSKSKEAIVYTARVCISSFSHSFYNGCPECRKTLRSTPRQALQWFCSKCGSGREEALEVPIAEVKLHDAQAPTEEAETAKVFGPLVEVLKQHQGKRTLLDVPWIARLRVTTNTFGVNMTMEKAALC